MFCTQCGKELSDDVSFCPNCGTKVLKHEADPDEDVRLETNPLVGSDQSKSTENLEMAQIVGKNAEYYLAEFHKIESHQKPRFNWAAFLLNIAFCFYRKCGFLFKKYFLIPIILYFATSALFYFGILSLNMTVTIAGGILFIFTSIFLLVNGIRFGKNFNKEYYEHCKAVTRASQCGVSIKGIVLTYVVILAVSVLVSIATGAVALNSINSLIEDSYVDNSNATNLYDNSDYPPDFSYEDPAESDYIPDGETIAPDASDRSYNDDENSDAVEDSTPISKTWANWHSDAYMEIDLTLTYYPDSGSYDVYLTFLDNDGMPSGGLGFDALTDGDDTYALLFNQNTTDATGYSGYEFTFYDYGNGLAELVCYSDDPYLSALAGSYELI